MMPLKSHRQRATLHRQDEDEFAEAYAVQAQVELPRQRATSPRPVTGSTPPRSRRRHRREPC